jgi:hypothetical protein
MNDLKKDVDALFEVGRRAHQPSSRDHERVLRGVLTQAAVAGVSGATVGAAAAKGALGSSRALAMVKLLSVFAVVGAGGAAVYHAGVAGNPVVERAPATKIDQRSQAASPLPAHVAPEPQAPTRVDTTDVTTTPERAADHATDHATTLRDSSTPEQPPSAPLNARTAVAPAAVPADVAAARAEPAQPAAAATQSFPPNAPPTPAAPPSAAPQSTVTLSREARALADVERALREGRGSDALAMLAEQSREFAGGALGQEREAARVMALCTSGRSAEGRDAAQRFLAAHAGSPVAAHIRASCGLP